MVSDVCNLEFGIAAVRELPPTNRSLLLRIDFTDDQAWNRLCDAIQEPSKEGFIAYFEYVNDLSYEGLTLKELTDAAINGEKQLSYICVADRVTLTASEQPILVIDCYDQPGRTFRVIPSEVWSVENNLSIANMDFREFADSCDSDGIFRGF